MSLQPYRLRAELLGHESDVRGVAADPISGRVATASRDSSALVWDVRGGSVSPLATLRGHNHFVNAVAFLPSGDVVSASSDHSVRIWKMNASGAFECTAILRGHENNVCDVRVIPGSPAKLLTSSWDTTVRVWDVGSRECVVVLRGHEAAVWAALPLSDGRIVSVGADKTVRLWTPDGKGHSILPSVHTDVVRAVAQGPNGGFVTVANDSAAVYWASNGAGGFEPAAQIRNLHDGSFAYSLATLPEPVVSSDNGFGSWLFASGGEDNAVRVMKLDTGTADLSCVQTIVFPGVVWSVAFAPNGDLVAGCSDGIARVFTRDPERVASTALLGAFEKAVAERQLNTKVIGGVDVAKLPTAEVALAVPGRKDGENKMVRTGAGAAEVHMWSAADAKWVKVGDVVDGPGGASMGGGEVNGKKYDFVFDVELGDGGAKKLLGYNRGENTYAAAQRFIDENDVNQDFLDQIAKFIDNQLPPDAVGAAAATTSDPLTGGSRYIPRSSGPSRPSSGSRGDPLTGGSRYIPGAVAPTAAEGSKLPPPRKNLPYSSGPVTYLTSDQVEKIQSKLAEFNNQLATQNSPSALTESEATVFGSKLVPKLKSKLEGSSGVMEDDECAVIRKMVDWPTSMVFPVLDIARLVVARPSGGAFFFGKQDGSILDALLRHMGSADASPAVLIMGCRFLCNMFGNRVVASAALRGSSEIIPAAGVAGKSENRRARETYASLLINYAMSLHGANASPENRALPLQFAVSLLSGGEKDEEVAFRLLLAIGTLMCGDRSNASKGLELGAAAAAAAVAPISARIQGVAEEIAALIAS